MADEKRKPKRSCHFRQKWLPAVCAILLLVLLAVGLSVRYISFVSQTIYQESTSHLEEVLHKSNNMLKETVRALVEGWEGGFVPFNRGSLPVVSGIAVEVEEDNGSYTLTSITRNGQPLRDDDTVTVTCLATEKQMAALPASESGTSAGEDTWVKNTWRDHVSGGGAALAEPENYMTLR